MTGEKFVRSLPFFRKRSFTKTFDECDDTEALDFLERLLTLEPSERMDTREALKHPYLKKHHSNGNGSDSTQMRKFDDEIYDGENWIELIRHNVEITD
jgi:serine/threonine protein kinase